MTVAVCVACKVCQNQPMNGDSGSTDRVSNDLLAPSLLQAAKRRFECADYRETERLAREALDVAVAQDDFSSIAQARTWLGAGLTQLGRYAAALQCLHDVLGVVAAHGLGMHTGRAYNYIAVCHEEMGDFPTAVGWYERGIAQARQAGDNEVAVYLLSNLADGWVTAGSVDKAMPLLDEAIDVARSIGDQAHEAWCLSARARLLENLGEVGISRRDHATAVVVARSSRAERILAETLRDEGAFLARNGDPESAIDRLQQALALAGKLDIRREMYRAHETLASVHEQRGQWELALRHYRQFHAIHADVFDDLVKAKLENLDAVSELQQARHQEEISRLRNDELATALNKVEQQATELERLSLHDALTGTCNRRYLETALDAACTCAIPGQQALCVAMLDVDHFKQINDRHGHAIGDTVLCRLARIVEHWLRSGDIIARYGGEEFVLVLPRIGMQQMHERAEAIRRSIEEDAWSMIASGLHVTISVGIASAEGTTHWETLLARADHRMYRAKNAGRNRVCGVDASGEVDVADG